MNMAIGIGGIVLYSSFNLPSQIQQLESEIDSMLLLPQDLITNVDTSFTSVNNILDVTTQEMSDVSTNFYQQAEFFWDWNVLGYHPETTTNIGNTFNELHNSIDTIIPSLTTIKGNLTQISTKFSALNPSLTPMKENLIQISTKFSALNLELNGFRTSSHAMLNSLTIITPVVYFICIFFIIQGLALFSLYLSNRNKNELMT